jgi:hypothetical protein
MTIVEIIEKKLAENNVTINGALYLDCDATDTKITVYDMNMTTLAKKKIAYYLVPFENMVLA